MSAPVLREANPADLPRLATIYTESVRSLAPPAYTAEQIAIWSAWPETDPVEFNRRLTAGHAWVAEIDGVVAAFAEFTPPDHLDFLYTHGDYARRGLATALHQKLESIARTSGAGFLRTEASYLSRPAFNTFGYQVFEMEKVVRSGMSFTRFKMLKRLQVGPPATGEALTIHRDHTSSLNQFPTAFAEERVEFISHDEANPGWFNGVDPRGINGYFPSAWFLIDEARLEAIAHRDYDARELSLTAGDHVYPIESVGPWSWVSTSGHKEGWIPQHCLHP